MLMDFRSGWVTTRITYLNVLIQLIQTFLTTIFYNIDFKHSKVYF